jgi:hypothetical protein
MTARPRNSLLIPILAGAFVATAALLVVVLVTDDDGGTTTSSTAPDTTTVTTAASSTTAAATTVGTTTSTAAASTTTFAGGTDTVTHLGFEGSPGPNLTDVRIGDHEGFVRVVFDLTGAGTPMHIVGYESPPFIATSGNPVPVSGTAFLAVHLSPAMRFDIDTQVPTYTGDLVLDPGLAPIEQIVFIDDFEAAMYWVIGLDAVRPFTVSVLQGPLRVVVDIAK